MSCTSRFLTGVLSLVASFALCAPVVAQTDGEPEASDDAGEPDLCLPVVAANCGCVYSCAPGWSVGDETVLVRHSFWNDHELTATVQQWCVDEACTDAFYAEIVCGGICVPRPADPTCGFATSPDGTRYCATGVNLDGWDPASHGFDYADQAGACMSHETPTAYTCQYDSDCVVCHDGSACGVVVDREESAARGDACQQEDAAECEYSRSRCCGGHCVRASY